MTLTPQQAIETHKIDVRAVFVPWSQSRNFKKGAVVSERTLNWVVTLTHKGQKVLATDYSAGIAHCPAYQMPSISGGLSVDKAARIERETETGKTTRNTAFSGPAILPDSIDVIYSLIMDSDAIEMPSFEEWAQNSGYDEDSRKGEAIYHQCLQIGLTLRHALGDSALSELREAFQDY